VVQSPLLAHQTHDDAFREIQLNGKQLVFLFMVATVVSVVIFLCGVFVGRGVRAERAPLVAETPAASAPVTTPDLVPEGTTAATPPAGSDPTAAAAPPPVDEKLTYFDRLEGKQSPPEHLKSEKSAAQPEKKSTAAEKNAARAAVAPAPPPPPAVKEPPAKASPAPKEVATAKESSPKEPPAVKEGPAPKAETAVARAAAEPGGSGFALQVTALKERNEAEAVAKRLAAKGYSAYVMTPPPSGTPKYYRVRIGKFTTRREAEDIATKLQKEEQIKPWITR